MKLEFLLCGSPTDSFFSQMAFFRLSLDHLGGDEAAARLVCVFGDHDSETIPERWKPWFERIEVHWAHAIGAENPSHLAQHLIRFDLIDPQADAVFLCDADVAPLAPMAPLVRDMLAAPALMGTIGHYHFPRDGQTGVPAQDWEEIAQRVLGRSLDLSYRYSMHPPESTDRAPFYLNLGVLAGTPALLRQFHQRDQELRPKVAEIVGDWWAPQVSLPLTCADLDLPVRAIGMRWNYPNDPKTDAAYPEEAANIGFLHYLRPHQFRRGEIFADPAAFQAFLDKPLSGSNATFQAHVRAVTQGIFPFPAPEACNF